MRHGGGLIDALSACGDALIELQESLIVARLLGKTPPPTPDPDPDPNSDPDPNPDPNPNTNTNTNPNQNPSPSPKPGKNAFGYTPPELEGRSILQTLTLT